MILNKYLSLALSVCLFVLLMLLASSLIMLFVPGSTLPFAGAIFIVIFFIASRAFYYYLRSDDKFKNTRKRTSDKKGELYWIKGEKDTKKLFIIIWIIVILIILVISMGLYLINTGLI